MQELGHPYVCECSVIKGFSGQLDFALINTRLLIQVDGVTHFKPTGWPKAKNVDQHEVDEHCCEQALAKGFNLLRIHHEDLQRCATDIMEVLDYILIRRPPQDGQLWSSVTWSPSFKRERVMRFVRERGGQLVIE